MQFRIVLLKLVSSILRQADSMHLSRCLCCIASQTPASNTITMIASCLPPEPSDSPADLHSNPEVPIYRSDNRRRPKHLHKDRGAVTCRTFQHTSHDPNR